MPFWTTLAQNAPFTFEVTIAVLYYPSDSDGNWWLYVDNEAIGYWPSSIFRNGYMQGTCNHVQWGGEVALRVQAGQTKHSTTAMGSGAFPTAGWPIAAYQKNLSYFDANGQEWIPDPKSLQLARQFNNSLCYDIQVQLHNYVDWGTYFFFGGPGGGSSACHYYNIQPMLANLAQQMKKMQAAQGRWETQLRNKSWISVSAREAGEHIKSGDYYFLDVRPSTEHSKASVKGSIWIPMYDVNKNADPATLYSKIQKLTMGGWWSGQALMKYNERFMPDIVARIPKSSKIIVSCQKGIRSLAACEQLYKVGYRNLYWLSGGLDAVDEGEIEREGPQPFKLAGIGGVSEFLGWTDVQRSEASKLGIGYRAMLFGRVVLLLLAVVLFFLGSHQLSELIAYLRH